VPHRILENSTSIIDSDDIRTAFPGKLFEPIDGDSLLAQDYVLDQFLDPARITAVRCGAANRIGCLDADRQVDIGTLGIKGIVAR
jgi:hypothetical protein